VPIDVRIVASAQPGLREQVQQRRFREDLYYRLSVFPIDLPPLKERSDAILPLAEYFAAKFGATFGKRVPALTEDAKSALVSYGWPGNIRELQNVIERAVILSSGTIEAALLNLEPEPGRLDAAGGLLKSSERELILKTLEETGGNRRRAAEVLGISLRTLQYRIKEFGL